MIIILKLGPVISYYHLALYINQGVPAGSPSRGGDVTVHVCDINQPSLPTPFYSVLVSISVFMVLSTVFHSINSPDNSPFSHSVLPVLSLRVPANSLTNLSLPYLSFQLYVSMKVSFSLDIIPSS